MSIEDLVYEYASTAIINPLEVPAGTTTVTVRNSSATEALTALKLYVTYSSSLGSTSRPSDATPELDYQDLLAWSEASSGTEGCIINIAGTDYPINRTTGCSFSTALAFGSLPALGSNTFDITFVLPASVPSRYLYIDIAVVL